MKLLTQTGLYMVTMSLFLFFACGVAFYFVFKTFTTQALDKDLDNERLEVMANPELFLKAVKAGIPIFDQLEFVAVKDYNPDAIAFYDSIVQSKNHSNVVPVRYIRFYTAWDEKSFEVKIYKSKISSDDLTVRITGLITLLALFFTIGIFLLNRYGFRQTWRDFWNSLQKVQKFKAGADPPHFEATEIDEFDALNQELLKMTTRISRDYHKLESFTSHTTHEFQTPLAVIRSKVELLMQSDNLTQEQMKEIQIIDQYAGQLSRLSQALSLLFKVDNQQFEGVEDINLSKLLDKHLEFLYEQAELLGIEVILDKEDAITLSINPSLADILFLNLLKNSLFHNFRGGHISITLEPGKLTIANTGDPSDIDPDKIFREFVKGKQSIGSGLGLSIAKRICDQYGIGLNYNYNNKIHSLILILPV